MTEARPIPRRPKEVIKAAEKGQWDRVFEALGCRLSVKKEAQEGDREAEAQKHDPCGEVLEVVKSDFWGNNVPLASTEERRLYALPMLPPEVIASGVFASLDIYFAQTPINFSETEEAKVLKLALAEENWAAITVVLFLFCRCGLTTKVVAVALRRAVEKRDWRYVHAIAADYLKFYFGRTEDMLQVLGLRNVMLDRAKRTSAIKDLLEDPEWDETVMEIIMNTIIVWCRRSGTSLEKWTAALETMEDFRCVTERIREALVRCVGCISMQRGDLRSLCEAALAKKAHFVLKILSDVTDLTAEQASEALVIAHEVGDWEAINRYIRFGAEADQFIKGESILHGVLRRSQFQFQPKFLPAWDIDSKSQGLTLLQTAVDCWLEDSSGNVVFNILFLLKNKADVCIPYPSGETVLQKLVDKAKDTGPSQGKHRLHLMMAAVKAAVGSGQKVDWTPAPGSEWSALHVLCDEGESDDIRRLVVLGANPLQHRRGLTLLDTAVLSNKPPLKRKIQVLQALFEVPGLIKDHVNTVQHRPASLSTFPLMHLLHETKKDASNFELVKILHHCKAFAKVEVQEAVKEENLASLQEHDLEDVVAFLVDKLDRSAFSLSLQDLDIGE